MFTSYPTYNPYRSLKLSTPHLKGEDVYALQTALIECGFSLPLYGADGDLGKETSDAIVTAQKKFLLFADGIAGPKTQFALAEKLSRSAAVKYVIPAACLRGQLQTESGSILGNYSPLRPDQTYDAGLCQRNTKFTLPQDGFDAAQSIDKLAAQIRQYYDKFAGISDRKRRWALAQGSWNAPAFACWVARQEGAYLVKLSECRQPSEADRIKFEAYVDSVSAYLVI